MTEPKVINGKDYLLSNKEKIREYANDENFSMADVSGVIDQISNVKPPCTIDREKGTAGSIESRLKFMARNEGENGSTFQYVARGLLDEAGIKGK